MQGPAVVIARLTDRRGLTLVEVLAAAAILVLTLAVIVGFFQSGLRLSYVSGRTTEAASLAQAKIEELRGQGFAALAKEPGHQVESVGRYTRETSLVHGYNGNPWLIRVAVTVSWEDDEGGHAVSLVTLVADTGNGG